MPEWFSHQCMEKNEVNIMEHFSHLCNDWIGIAVCIVFCPLPHHQIHGNLVVCTLRANGKNMPMTHIIDNKEVASSNHICLLYLIPQRFEEEDRKLLWECDANGFHEIGIKIYNTPTSLVKKCGLRVVYNVSV